MCEQKRVIALGFFDGVHLGHGALLRRVTERAEALGAVPCAFTFDAHPSAYLTGEQVPLLNSVEDREWLMKTEYGIQQVIVAPFRQMMTMSWEDFITAYLLGEQHAVHVVAGYDFHFGARGQGNPERLKAKCARLGMGCDIVGEIELEGIRVSSTYIRTLMEAGDMDRARQFLGHPHVLSGTVQPGKHLGHTLGFPTVNLPFAPGVMVPDYGVYAAKVTLEDGTCCNAVTNIGVRPTVETGAAPNVEAFLLNYQGDLYGQQVRVAFYHRLRGERRFPSVEALAAEVLRNAEQTRAYFQEVG